MKRFHTRALGLAALLTALAACSGGGGGGGGGTTCNNTCPSIGKTQCSGALVQTCAADSSGCLAWSAAASCGAARTCSSVSNACVADLCQGVPTNGVCASSTTVQFCGAPTGDATLHVLSYECSPGQQCQIQNGKASCVLIAACVDGQTQCGGASTLQTCTGGLWQSSNCTGACLNTALGGVCGSAAPTTTFSGRVLFEYRAPNAGLTDWASAPSLSASPAILVVSGNANGTIYDAVYTDLASATMGQFTIKVPASPTVDDALLVVAAADDGAGKLAFAIADPNFAISGIQAVGPTAVGTSPRAWSWRWPLSGLTNGQDLTITEAMGAGAANVHFNMVRAYVDTFLQFGHAGPPVVIWLGYGTSWSCGSCFAPWPTNQFGVPFAGQMFLGGDSNQQFWADPVTSHELGHWTMAFYGTSPNEGGPHMLSIPTFPGQAWSEGWATWFSSDVRADPIYYDKQAGSFFWMSIADRTYSAGVTWHRPSPTSPDGLLQLMDENEVSAMLWKLSSLSANADAALFSALASPRMNTGPFKRGYTRHVWDVAGPGNFVNVVTTGDSVPMVADFLDALECAGVSRTVIDNATQPTTFYPFPSAAPICQ